MIECPSCKHQEFVGTLYCSECGTRLVHTAIFSDMSGDPDWVDLDVATTETGPGSGLELDSGATLGLRVLATGDMVPLVGRDNYTLGRGGAGQAIVPDVDLDRYGAQDQGISRLHAEIRIDEGGVHVVDLDSVNGTLVNGERLEPQEPHRVSHKDMIQLGRLRMQLISRYRGQ
jgi:hypothetical protein